MKIYIKRNGVEELVHATIDHYNSVLVEEGDQIEVLNATIESPLEKDLLAQVCEEEYTVDHRFLLLELVNAVNQVYERQHYQENEQ